MLYRTQTSQSRPSSPSSSSSPSRATGLFLVFSFSKGPAFALRHEQLRVWCGTVWGESGVSRNSLGIYLAVSRGVSVSVSQVSRAQSLASIKAPACSRLSFSSRHLCRCLCLAGFGECRGGVLLVTWQLPENVANLPLWSGEFQASPPLGLKGHLQSFLSVTWSFCASRNSLINSSTLPDYCD